MDNKREQDATKILIHCTPSLNILGVCVLNHWVRKKVASERFEKMIVEKCEFFKSIKCYNKCAYISWDYLKEKTGFQFLHRLVSFWMHLLVYWCWQTWWKEIPCCKFGICRVNHKFDKIYKMTSLAKKAKKLHSKFSRKHSTLSL